LNGIEWCGVQFVEVTAGLNDPEGAGNKDREHVLMFVRLEKNRIG
jgi:hypothetical protein